METFKLKSLTSPVKQVFSSLLCFATISLFTYFLLNLVAYDFLFFFFMTLILLFVMLLLVLLFGFEGIDVDTDKKTWRAYTGFLGMKSGKHIPIPYPINYILIFKGDFKTFTSAKSVDYIDEYYVVSIVYQERFKQDFSISSSLDKSQRVAQRLRKLFGIEIIENIQ